jgi:Icc-related predicted phosphoesterase
MKLTIWSDLHLEFWDHVPKWKNNAADVLVLSGDICLADHFRRSESSPYRMNAQLYHAFFRHVSQEFPIVFYILGNHEHYSGQWDLTATILKEELSIYNNIVVLDNNTYFLDGINFYGASFWTSMDNGNPVVMETARNSMNDYHVVTQRVDENYFKLQPATTVARHNYTMNNLEKYIISLDEKYPVVVLGHHAPSSKSIHPRFANQNLLNFAYYSDLDQYIIDNPQIKLWTCGHVHHSHQYKINNTLVVCNPHGYGNENPKFNPNLVIEI